MPVLVSVLTRALAPFSGSFPGSSFSRRAASPQRGLPAAYFNRSASARARASSPIQRASRCITPRSSWEKCEKSSGSRKSSKNKSQCYSCENARCENASSLSDEAFCDDFAGLSLLRTGTGSMDPGRNLVRRRRSSTGSLRGLDPELRNQLDNLVLAWGERLSLRVTGPGTGAERVSDTHHSSLADLVCAGRTIAEQYQSVLALLTQLQGAVAAAAAAAPPSRDASLRGEVRRSGGSHRGSLRLSSPKSLSSSTSVAGSVAGSDHFLRSHRLVSRYLGESVQRMLHECGDEHLPAAETRTPTSLSPISLAFHSFARIVAHRMAQLDKLGGLGRGVAAYAKRFDGFFATDVVTVRGRLPGSEKLRPLRSALLRLERSRFFAEVQSRWREVREDKRLEQNSAAPNSVVALTRKYHAESQSDGDVYEDALVAEVETLWLPILAAVESYARAARESALSQQWAQSQQPAQSANGRWRGEQEREPLSP